MSKSQFKTFLIVALLISNLTLIGFQLFSKPERRHGHPEPQAIIIKRLGFDAQQIKAYKKLIDEHQKVIHEKDFEIRQLKQQLFIHLSPETPAEFSDSIFQKLGQVQSQIEKNHIQHFKDLRKICRKDQLPRFEKLSKELGKIFSTPPIRK